MGLVGIDKQLETLQTWLEDWKGAIPPAKKVIILVGPPGVGKTSSVYQVSKELGFDVCEFNTSDTRDDSFFKMLYSRISTKPIVPTVYLLDEADGIENQDALIKLASHVKNPVILTANDVRKLPREVRDEALILKFWHINVQDVVSIVGKVEDYSLLSGDVRQSELVKFGSQSYSSEKEPMEKFLNGSLEEVDRYVLVTILDNAHRWLYGFDLYKLLRALVTVDRTKRAEILKEFRGIGKDWEFSYYYDKLRKANVRKK